MLVKILVASDKLLHDDQTLRFRQFLPLFEDILQRPLVAQFLEEIDVVGRFLDIVQLHNILVLDGFHYLDLVFERIVKFLRVFLYLRG